MLASLSKFVIMERYMRGLSLNHLRKENRGCSPHYLSL